MRTWTSAELRGFLDAVRGDYLHPLWLFYASTGVRRSDALGLRWSDVDLAAGTATIRQTVLRSAEGYRPQQDQKTRQSARTIHLDRRTLAALRAHRLRQQPQSCLPIRGPHWAV